MKKKKVLIGSGIVLILLIASLIGGSLYMLDFSLRPVNRGKDMEGSMAYMRQTYPHIVPWIDSLNQCRALRDTFITAPDGIRMHAFYVRAPRPTTHTAVIIHGYTDNAIRMFHIGYLYNRSLGYNKPLFRLQHPPARPALYGTDRRRCHPNGLARPERCHTMDKYRSAYLRRFHPSRGARHLNGSRHHNDGFGREASRLYTVFCGRLRIYQCMGPVQERTERSVPPARLSFIICDRMDMPASERMELPRGFGSESSKEMPQTHAFHSWR